MYMQIVPEICARCGVKPTVRLFDGHTLCLNCRLRGRRADAAATPNGQAPAPPRRREPQATTPARPHAPRDVLRARLRFLRWLAERDELEHRPVGPPVGPYAIGEPPCDLTPTLAHGERG